VGFRWFDRFLGVISLAILARLLDPESFGIVAMASIVVGLLDAVFDMGVHVLVLQKDDPDEDFMNSAWTLRLFQSILLGTFIAILAPFAADYFSEPRVTNALYVLALASVVYGFENFALVEFQKSRQFFQEFKLSSIKRICMFIIVIILAYMLESYWALILGTLISRMVGVFLAYWFHPVIHKISFIYMRRLFGSGKWLLFLNMLTYLCRRVNEIVVGRFFSSSILGNYTIASEVAALPTQELMAPISRALLPGFTSMKSNIEETKNLIYNSINIQASIALPAAAGLVICAEQVVLLFLGEKWVLAGQLLTILPFIYAAAALRYTGEYYLIAHQKQKLLTYIALYYLGSFVAAVMYSHFYLKSLTLEFIIYARVAIEISGIVIMWYLTSVVSGVVTIWGQIKKILRPLFATIVMCVVLLLVGNQFANVFMDLVFRIILGAITYTSVLSLTWLTLGKPLGLESWVYDRVASKL
jgi:O-antigen/teichoic acid export membrane protein